jgi:hypothetical protein
MRDLSAFPGGSFDVVFHPVSSVVRSACTGPCHPTVTDEPARDTTTAWPSTVSMSFCLE